MGLRIEFFVVLSFFLVTATADGATYGSRAVPRASLARDAPAPSLVAYTWGIGGDRVARPSNSRALPPLPVEFADRDREDVVAIAASGHTAFATASGALYTAGRNASDGGGGRGSPPIADSGQIGRGGNTDAPGRVRGALVGEKVTSVGCGRYHTVVGTASGAAYTFGLNDRGQLGALGTMGVVLEGTKCACDSGENCACAAHAREAKVGEACFGGAACRSGEPKRVDFGDADVRVATVAAGRYTSAVVSTNGEVYVWGLNACGGDAGLARTLLADSRVAAKPRLIKGIFDVVKVDIGYVTMIFLTSKGEVYTCYTGFDGYAGLNEASSARTTLERHSIFSSGSGAADVATGRCHYVVSTVAGKVYTWGCSTVALGREYGERSTPTPLGVSMSQEFVVAVAAGEYFTLMTTRQGDIFGVGESNNGQLGIEGSGARLSSPSRLTSIPRGALAVAAGYQHAAAVVRVAS